MPDMDLMTDFSEFEELEAMFGQDSSDLAKMEKVMLMVLVLHLQIFLSM